MKHIDEFRIHAFRGLRDLKLEELGQINLFVGNNNSGKTSVLEAFSLFCNPLSWRRWYDSNAQREGPGGGIRSSVPDRVAWLFPQHTTEKTDSIHKISMSASGDAPIREVAATYQNFKEFVNIPPRIRNSEEIVEDQIGDIEEEVEGINVFVSIVGNLIQPTLFEDTFKREEKFVFNFMGSSFLPDQKLSQNVTIPVQMVNPFSHRTSSLTVRLWSEVVEADLKEETIQLLQYFDPAIRDVDFISPTERRPLISVKHEKLGRTPLYTFGDGLRRIFTLATTIPRVRNGFLLIDELETAIHTKALEKTFNWLIKACIDNNIQLLATTHSLEALDALLEASREQADFVVYRLQQEEAQTTATRFDTAMTLRLREDLGMELRY